METKFSVWRTVRDIGVDTRADEHSLNLKLDALKTVIEHAGYAHSHASTLWQQLGLLTTALEGIHKKLEAAREAAKSNNSAEANRLIQEVHHELAGHTGKPIAFNYMQTISGSLSTIFSTDKYQLVYAAVPDQGNPLVSLYNNTGR